MDEEVETMTTKSVSGTNSVLYSSNSLRYE